jgi:hypothetical protein
MLWRGHANQGRCQPGRRAVLEETKEPSDRTDSTSNMAFSQGEINHERQVIAFIFNLIQLSGYGRKGCIGRKITAIFRGLFPAPKSIYQIRIGMMT